MQKLNSARVHFIGIGGIGMCGIAEVMSSYGAAVSGSDLVTNVNTERLSRLGVRIQTGHQPELIVDAQVVVFSSAVKANNPEYAYAIKNKIPLIPRAEALAEIMRLKRGLLVAGTHGKTTTTSFAATLMLGGGLSPTVVVGGRLASWDSTTNLGSGDWFVAEADESDGSFRRLSPEIAIITNIDTDHLDHFGTVAELKAAFREFADRIPFYGLVVACGDNELLRDTLKDFAKPIVWYGFDAHNDVVLSAASGHRVQVMDRTTHDGGSWQLTSPMPGRHNLLNATAAMLAARKAGLDPREAAKALACFGGVDRRFQFKGKAQWGSDSTVEVYDDYAHHPTEIRATLAAMREHRPDQYVRVVFEPHRYSRTEMCWQDFSDCFSAADEIYVLDIYPAGEAPREGIHSQALVADILHPRKHYVAGANQVISRLRQEMRSGDVIVTLGAGSVWRIADQLVQSARV